MVGSALMSASPTRRQVLASAVVLGATACTSGRPGRTNPDTALRSAAVERERALIAAYDALLARRPADAPLLRALRAEHASHLAALDPLAAPPSASASPPPVDRARLRALERAAATAHGAAAVGAGRALAGVLASCSASEASHAVALA